MLGDGGGDLQQPPLGERAELVVHINHPTRAQVFVVGQLDHLLAVAAEPLHQHLAAALLGVPVRVVEHHHCSVQQTRISVVAKPFQDLARRRRAVQPRGGHHDQRVDIAEHRLGDSTNPSSNRSR